MEAFGELIDADGNVYATIKIGNQEWLAENLRVTHYSNGDPVPNVMNAIEWSKLKSGSYSAYANKTSNIEAFGLLYNWYAISDKRNIAPQGWHVPTDEDWKELEEYLDNQAASKLKTTRGWYKNTNGTNESGFTALPSGFRNVFGEFNSIGRTGGWWSSTAQEGDFAWLRTLRYITPEYVRGEFGMQGGFSVRLVRD